MKAPPIIIEQPANIGNDHLGLSNMKAAAPPIFLRNNHLGLGTQSELGRNILATIETINEK